MTPNQEGCPQSEELGPTVDAASSSAIGDGNSSPAAADYPRTLCPNTLPGQISAARADQILCQVVSGEGGKASHIEWKHPDGTVPNEVKSFWFLRSYVVKAIQEAVVWANTQIVIPGTAMHDHYDLLLSLTRGAATSPEQLEAAILLRKLIEDRRG